MATWDLTALFNAADAKASQAERHLWLARLMEWLRHAPVKPPVRAATQATGFSPSLRSMPAGLDPLVQTLPAGPPQSQAAPTGTEPENAAEAAVAAEEVVSV